MHSKLFVGIYFACANSSLKRFSRHKQWAHGIVALVGSLFFIFCFCSCFVLLLSFALFCSFYWKKIDNKPISKYVTYHQVVSSTKEKTDQNDESECQVWNCRHKFPPTAKSYLHQQPRNPAGCIFGSCNIWVFVNEEPHAIGRLWNWGSSHPPHTHSRHWVSSMLDKCSVFLAQLATPFFQPALAHHPS